MNMLFGWNSLSRPWISYKSVICLQFQVLSAPPPGSPSIKPPTSSTGIFWDPNWEIEIQSPMAVFNPTKCGKMPTVPHFDHTFWPELLALLPPMKIWGKLVRLAELRAGKVEKVSTTPQILCFFRWFPRDRWCKLENTRKVEFSPWNGRLKTS